MKTKTILSFIETEKGIKLVKDTFEKKLSKKLHLLRVTAPRFLITGTGLQDDLAGLQKPVSFKTKFSGSDIEVVHSLAKWKRYTLGKHCFKPYTGLYTDMDAIRKDEDVDDIHSIYVDQWDWEVVMEEKDRKIDFLKSIVKKIYSTILETESVVGKKFPELKQRLPKHIYFVHSEELEKRYPRLLPKDRERMMVREFGAVFVIGIGHGLMSGKPHDIRAADYDDWSTDTEFGKGLNGDILVWDYGREDVLELSSMGIRVDADALRKQCKTSGVEHYLKRPFHKAILEKELPLTIGGGIGQSRLCQFLLQKRHICEVQSSVWPQEWEEKLKAQGIFML